MILHVPFSTFPVAATPTTPEDGFPIAPPLDTAWVMIWLSKIWCAWN